MEIRAFFALTLPDAVTRWLADHADTLCQYDKHVEVNWIDSESYHLTLCFLGNISLEQVDQLEQLTRKKLAEVSSFQVHINTAEYYPVSKQLAVVAAMSPEHEALTGLNRFMMEIALEAGIEFKEEDFKPHITLGRLPAKNKFVPPQEWPELDLYSLADSVVLFQSKPGERDSIYTPLFEIPLQDMA
ncbi:RNA 2',3'-cyclic phosphodiesterase [Amphritea balenae]|uniref:RNA 2',3'-cyclic phosphodiesterase n=1 Tax=Amphritea balenae TaxID=452629 RepID=A0A3P1SPU0_9GAMM|nr:RNA 2',3'-cyclic phosphodiesterase [Amphritea balenae]RRC98232.1 RNA 2',3'-cyclic phosphodiesterase [Amphritea balenae]GGK80292.1 RNA 2',3'-cyclic phosphodiesterase [Amphritea balenae]